MTTISSKNRRLTLIAWGFLILLTYLVYRPSLQGDFLWDDAAHVQTDSKTLSQIWVPGNTAQYYPLTYSLFYLEREYLWGNWTEGYHLVNLLLQILNAVLLWRILCLLSIPGAWLAAALFTLHPINVETVAWISERKNLFSYFFYLGALVAYLKFLRHENKNKWRLWVLAFGLFICAVLSKTVTCTFPAIIIILLWWRNERLSRRNIYPLIPFFLAGLLAGACTVYLEIERVGAKGELWEFSWIERILIAGRAIIFYLQKTIWPHPLIFNYPRWIIDAYEWKQYLYPATVLICLIIFFILYIFKKTGKSPLAVSFIYLINLFPALGFFNLYPMRFSFVADHFQYFAGIVPMALFAFFFQKLPKRPRILVSGIVLFILCVLSWRQSHAYKNPHSLWDDILKKNPDSCLALNSKGFQYFLLGKNEEAMKYFQATLGICPDNDTTYCNLGYAAEKLEDFELAAKMYKSAINLNPRSVIAHNNYANMMVVEGNVGEAIEHYQKAIKISPDFAESYTNIALLLFQGGETAEAFKYFDKSLALNPNVAETHFAIAKAYIELGDTKKAIQHLKRCLEINYLFKAAQDLLTETAKKVSGF